MDYNLLVPYTSNRTRTVRLLRRGPPNIAEFGFSIRGGREHGTGFFVSAVELNSEAHLQGLRIGDQIVRINGFSVEDAIHQEVLHLIQSYNHLNLRVRSVGMIPVKDKKHDPLSWRMVEDKKNPRPFVRSASEVSIMEGPSTFDEARDVKLFLDTTNHTSLGVSICKGTEQRPGIFVQSTREGGLAWEAGLAMGDQILECNGVNFENITFDDAVKVLKNHKQLDILIRKGAGIEIFGESSGYNSSTSSLNGDGGSPRDGGKRLSLITEDPEDSGERSRSNSRRGADETVTIVTQHTTSTIITSDTHQEKLVQVSAQVHRGPDEDNHALERSSSGSSVSSLSSGISHEVKRRNERREEEERRRREIALKVVPEERRQTHAIQLMQEFQEAHRRMFAETERKHEHNVTVEHYHEHHEQHHQHHQHHRQEERIGHETYNGDIYAVVQNGSRHSSNNKPRPAPLSVMEAEVVSAALAKPEPATPQRRGVEMTSIDTLTLSSPVSPKPKPPATYFNGGKSSKSQPGVVTISEYPNSDRRSAPSKLEFISNGSNEHNNHDDPQSALHSELQHTLSRSNLRQLSEPSSAPPPPIVPSPPSSPPPVIYQQKEEHSSNRPISPPAMYKTDTEEIHKEINGIELRKVPHQQQQVKPPFRRPPSILMNMEPPVRALKPVAEPYTEMVTQKNKQLFNYVPPETVVVTTQTPAPIMQVATAPVPPPPEAAPEVMVKQPIKSPGHTQPGHQLDIMDALSNKVTIKFANGESQSAGAKGLNALIATAPAPTPSELL